MDRAEEEVPAYMTFPLTHRTKLHSTNPGRLNHEIKRRTDAVGIFPNEATIRRLVGAILLEQNDEWAFRRARYMPRDTSPKCSTSRVSSYHPWQTDLRSQARCLPRLELHHGLGHDPLDCAHH